MTDGNLNRLPKATKAKLELFIKVRAMSFFENLVKN